MEDDEELKFVCKLCDKRYPCGKSLGGHMRSHAISNSAESQGKKVEAANIKNDGSYERDSRVEFFGNSGYGLRENPKKTWRIVSSNNPLPQDRVCKQCGKGFQSLKALCGHMACHSEKERVLKDDNSWSSENQKQVMDDYSDAESEDLKKPRKRHKNKRYKYKKIFVKSSSVCLANNGSSVSEIDEQEQEELAICLMMLSRGSVNWGGVNSAVESSDNNSVVLETKSSSIDMKFGTKKCLKNSLDNGDETLETINLGIKKLKSSGWDDDQVAQYENSDSDYFIDGSKKVESVISVDAVSRNGEKQKFKVSGAAKYKDCESILEKTLIKEKVYNDAGIFSKSMKFDPKKRTRDEFFDSPESSDAKLCKKSNKRSKYECLNCNKTFNSFQGLGGHRPCHKRNNVSSVSRCERGENSVEHDFSPDFELNGKLGESFSHKKPVGKDSLCNTGKGTRPKKNKGHECPFCGKIFKSGQALGGHKRSHFVGGHEESINQTAVMKQELRDLFDLNLPAPMEDEAEGDVTW